MIVEKTKLDGVLLIKLDGFEDHRGGYLELYNAKLYKSQGIDIDFVEDDISIATGRVIKGIHGDDCTWKLISCLHGKFYLVAINYDKESKHFGEWESFVPSESNKHQQVLVPPKHGNGHLCLSEKSIFHYKQSAYYDPSRQFTIKWNDPRFNIWWPVKSRYYPCGMNAESSKVKARF
ncbi:MAG: dTDP-4-dehydrorhamnose 3,5-epimerase family protein [Thermodesulfobacteriota bacterium]|nr:dTDP-4-dehydrorhamnose 3,5-epimerase family protein [Thermodesulfobacteriota bacterium]